ncbi:MAG: class I SAM-dependent methyltransferase [Anaerolineae bacterium]|nr:class I SAM-dependent methyltransferase [Phycisphaerae bacterium]
MKSSAAQLQSMYRQQHAGVRGSNYDRAGAERLFEKYFRFIGEFVPAGTRLLDVGCGAGWTSLLLSERGYSITGIDLNAAGFEPAPRGRELQFVAGSAQAIPFVDGSFDVAASYAALEHMPDPQAALSEMLRVVRPGGAVIVVSPNILCPINGLRGVLIHSWRNRPVRRIFLRAPDMPRHPSGNTLPESAYSIVRDSARLVAKLLRRGYSFSFREPDLRPPFHADNDACYLCNPIDIVRYYRSRGCTIMRDGYLGRPRWTSLLASGTFVAVRKSGGGSPRMT